MPLLNIVLTNRGAGGGGVCGCPLTFGAVMGQEDLYRKEMSVIVENHGTARIVWATSAEASSRVIYSGGDEALDQDTGVVATGNIYHEVFITDLNVDTLYAFQVISVSPECSGETIQSDTYFFQIGGEVTQIATNMTVEFLMEVNMGVPVTITENMLDDITITFDTTTQESIDTVEMDTPTATAETIDANEADEIGASELFTTHSTAVV